MTSRRCALVLLLTTLTVFPLLSQPITADRIAAEVRDEFLHFWKAYGANGLSHDGLAPVSGKPVDRYGPPFHLTALYALDLLRLMQLDAQADSTTEYLVRNLSFDRDVYVPTAEFAGPVLGALIANYQLTADRRFLELAQDLGNRMSKAFVSPTGMPYREVNLKTGAVRGNTSTPAEIGGLMMDLGALTMVTGSPVYYNHAKIAILQLYDARSPVGLVGEEIDITTGEWTKRSSHLGPEIGPYYEAVLKSAYLFEDADCAQIWQTHYDAINRFLLDSTARGYWFGRADMRTGKRTSTATSSYDAFLPTTQALFKDFDRAQRSMVGFTALWTRYGLQPDLFNYKRDRIEKPAFVFPPKYAESLYTLYRTSGEGTYLEMGRTILGSIRSSCRTDHGYAELSSVVTRARADRLNPVSFIATMRTLFLLFAPPDVLNFDQVLLDPSGHPIRKAW